MCEQENRWRIPVHEMYAEPRATQHLRNGASVRATIEAARKIAEETISNKGGHNVRT